MSVPQNYAHRPQHYQPVDNLLMDNLLENNQQQGTIMTFYSYKGGTGRTMALANTACLLARQGKRVLMIDWDLEAPGLHRYFVKNLQLDTEAIKYKLGLLDFIHKIQHRLPDDVKEANAQQFIDGLSLSNYVLPVYIEPKRDSSITPELHLLKAGTFSDKYPDQVNSFNWHEFFNQAPFLFKQFAHYLKSQYDYVLIDSRTGVTDTSGICTALLPDKLVVVFTPNRQSLEGVLETTRTALEYRLDSTDFRPLMVYPLPSRLEIGEQKLFETWRYGEESEEIAGYQQSFETLFQELYALERCDMRNYFDDVQIQHVPHYSYGEKVAVLEEAGDDRLSLSIAYETVLDRVNNTTAIWQTRMVTLTKEEEEEEEVLLRQIKKRPNAISYSSYIQFLEDDLKDYDRAEEFYQKAIEAYPKEELLQVKYAYFLQTRRKDFDKAEQLYTKAIKLDSNNALINTAYAYFLQNIRKDYDKAEQFYSKALELDPSDAATNGNYAQFLFWQDNSDKAIEYFEKSLKLNTDKTYMDNDLQLELYFYAYAHQLNNHPNSLNYIKALLQKAERSIAWDLQPDVDIAIKNEHPEPQLLQTLADVITKDETLEKLEQFEAWQNA